jgi:hypothetical protein
LSASISPNPNTQSVPGGGTAFFSFGASVSGGSGSGYTGAWSTGDTGFSTSFTEHAFPSEETDGTVGFTAGDSLGNTASDSADWIADGF